MADCVLPEEIMVCILTRLPVKSIIRFKSVCKSWRDLFSTPEFTKLHLAQFSNDQKNECFIIRTINDNSCNTISLYNIESNVKKPTILDHPFSRIDVMIEIVGCCNGLICIREGHMFVLWNPALKLSKSVYPKLDHVGVDKTVSLGFGYDAVGADFKVVRILCVRKRRQKVSVGAEVYSVNSDSWTTIELDFQFSVFSTKSNVIVNGNPYWYAQVDENERGTDHVLVCFDVTNSVFKVVPLLTFSYAEGAELEELVDWYGSLGALVCVRKNEMLESLAIWVFDEGERVWRKNQAFGPIKMNVFRFLLCLKKGKFLGQRTDGKLVVFYSESENGCVRLLSYGPRGNQAFGIYGYTETLANFEGMKQVKLRKRTRNF